MQAGYHQQQIQNYGAAGTQALNTAGAEGNIARGQLSQASQYANLGGQYGNMGSQLDARAGRALGAGMQYEGMGYQALQDQTSISNRRVERQDKFRMSDAAARSRVDSFNNSRANMGLQNTLGVIRTGVEVAGAFATGGTSLYASAAVRAAEAAAKSDGAKNNNSGVQTASWDGPPGRQKEYGSSVSKPSFNSNAYTPMTMEGSSTYNPYQPMENYQDPRRNRTREPTYTGNTYESYGTGYQPMQNPNYGMFDTGALGSGRRGVKKWWEKQNASNYQQPNYGAY